MRIESERAGLAHARQERERLLRLLRKSQERLQLVQQAANIGIFDWNIRTGAIAWTAEAEKLFGLQPGTFRGTFEAWERCVHPDDLAEARQRVLESVAGKTDLDIQFRVIWPEDQSIHWLYARAHTFYDQRGKPLHMIGINIDVTDRKLYEEALRLSDEKVRLFAESNIIGLLYADIYGRIHYGNDAFFRLIGYDPLSSEARNLDWSDITPPEWLSVDQQYIAESQRTGKPIVYEKQYIHKNGSRVDVLIGFRLFGSSRDQGVVFVLDMTERKRLERQKDEFIGVVSHELRTPVTSLKAFAQLLQKRFEKSGDKTNAELLMKMGLQIDKLTRLVADLIDVTRMEAGKLQLHETEFDLVALLSEIIEEMQRMTAQHVLIKESCSEVLVWGDRHRMGQVFTNLLSNAIKYSPQADRVLIAMTKDSECVTVGVQDFGLGIPLEQQEQIFQRFYRADDKKLETIPGLGLGLYISAEMMKRQGGDIWFESIPGGGSTFFVRMPLSH